MSKKYEVKMDAKEVSRIVHLTQHQNSPIAQQEFSGPLACVMGACLSHVIPRSVFDILDEIVAGSDNLDKYKSFLSSAIDSEETEPAKRAGVAMLRDCQNSIDHLEAEDFEDRLAYDERVREVLKAHVRSTNILKTWRDHSQREGYFMGKLIPKFEKENFEEEATEHFKQLIAGFSPVDEIDDELIDFLLNNYHLDGVLLVSRFFQSLYSQSTLKTTQLFENYEGRKLADCVVCDDGSLRFEFAIHYFPKHEHKNVAISERYILLVKNSEEGIRVTPEELSITFYDESLFKEFLTPVLASTIKNMAKANYYLTSLDKSLFDGCAQYYWENKNADASSFRQKLECGDLDGERLFALAWARNEYLHSILHDPLLLGKICQLPDHLALIQKLKSHTFNKTLQGKLETLQIVLNKLKPNSDHELDSKDKQIRIFMIAGLFGLHFVKMVKSKDADQALVATPDKEKIKFARSLLTTTLASDVDFDLAKWLGVEFQESTKQKKKAKKVEVKEEDDDNLTPLEKCKKEIGSCSNSRALVAKCHEVWRGRPDDDDEQLEQDAYKNAYKQCLQTNPEKYLDSFMMLNPDVQAEILSDSLILFVLLKGSKTAEKLAQDDKLLEIMLERIQTEFGVDESLSVSCLRILVNHLKKPMRTAMLRDNTWRSILFKILLSDLSELPLIVKMTDEIKNGLMFVTLPASAKQQIYLLLSLNTFSSTIKRKGEELEEQIKVLSHDTSRYETSYLAEVNAAKVIAHDAAINPDFNIDDAEAEAKAHRENAKQFKSQFEESRKQLAILTADLDLTKRQRKAIEVLNTVLVEKLEIDRENTNPLALIRLLYDNQNIEPSNETDEAIVTSLSKPKGRTLEISSSLADNASLKFLGVLVLVDSVLNKTSYLPESFIHRLHHTEEDEEVIAPVLELLDACFINPNWIFNLFNHWEQPTEKAVELFKSANAKVAESFHPNRDFLEYLCKVNRNHLSDYVIHFERTRVNEWVPLLNQYRNVDELIDLYVAVYQTFDTMQSFCEAFMTQPFLDMALLFASAEKISKLIAANPDCESRVCELCVNDTVFRTKISKHQALKERIIEDEKRSQFSALHNNQIEKFSSQFLVEWFMELFTEKEKVFQANFLRPDIIRRMLQPSYNRTEIRVLPVLVRALQNNSAVNHVDEMTGIVKEYMRANSVEVALQDAEPDILLKIFQLNVKSELAQCLRGKLLQSDELKLKLFVEVDESSLTMLIRTDSKNVIVNWVVDKFKRADLNAQQLIAKRLYACEMGDSDKNTSLIGCVFANLALNQLSFLVNNVLVCRRLAFQFSHSPVLLNVLDKKISKVSAKEFLKLFSPLNRGFAEVLETRNNKSTRSAWARFLKITLSAIEESKISRKELVKYGISSENVEQGKISETFLDQVEAIYDDENTSADSVLYI